MEAEVLLLRGGTVLFAAPQSQIGRVVGSPAPSRGPAGESVLAIPEPVPWCSLADLVGEPESRPERALVVEIPGRGRVAYGATAVLEVMALSDELVRPLPPFLREGLLPRGILGIAFLPQGLALLADLTLLHPAIRHPGA